MITLRIQILSFVFSFLYGIIVNLLFKCFKKYLYYNNFVYKILNSLLFMIDITLIYFKCFLVISDGYISIYFVIISIVTFFRIPLKAISEDNCFSLNPQITPRI